jgi:hypothetical protein
MTQPAVNVEFRLDADGIGLTIDVRIRSFGDRWMAVAEIDGEPEVGLGRTARQALEASLGSLGQRVTRTILADLQLLAPSVEIARQERTSA